MRTSLAWLLVGLNVACSSSSDSTDAGTDASSPTDSASQDVASPTDSSTKDGPTSDAGGLPAGWLYTSGAKIYVSDGAGGGTQWMGRGVNMDDIYLCGYNYKLNSTNTPDTFLKNIISGLMSAWKPTFVRISLGMNSYPVVSSWTSNDAQYKTPMTGVINAIGSNPNVYALVTLRSDVSMMEDPNANDKEATGMPTAATDAVYQAIVDSFANSKFVLFGLSNEPGGSTFTDATIRAAMDHAVGVIRAEEDKLGVPHHIVSVQGSGYTSDISTYATTPLTYDNVVYEVHGYPPPAKSYTYTNIPVILGEYGDLTDSNAFYTDVESKQIPNMAWDFEPYSDCDPDLLTVNQSSTNLVASPWGSTVQTYLLKH